MNWKHRLMGISRDTVLKALVVLVSLSVVVNSFSVAFLVVERNDRQEADQTGIADRNELRQRARTVECFIVGLLDPLVDQAQHLNRPLSPDVERGLGEIRRPANVEAAARQVCEPFAPATVGP